ncbi:hypothetical protein BS47DRAFT_1443938 [Hydnum rufescens UP504]|uniref:Timeless N-terminal domain-containing protein n=1 Tax=Hydnum rufescens UP504 TaxID=1448309 RepID=A0A9P6B1R1_9AGAM|nr:hypothetical protein BS47DRAFT_1443938 [Hydnum rufescens UP504]
MDRVVDISSEEEDEPQELSRHDILAPFIQSSVSALGGLQIISSGRVYEMGDSCLGCLKDLKKFWRKDDTDDERTVARIFWETRVLANDLVHILLETAGKGAVEDKRAIACADLITAMTWPIDVAEELKELDEEVDVGTDYTLLLRAQLSYKAELLRPDVLKAFLAIMAPPMAKSKRQADRTERDGQIINVILHAFRNLAFIKDLPVNAHASSDQAEYSSLQSKMIVMMQETRILDVFLTLAANTTDSLFNPYNAVLLEIFSLLYRGVKPQALALEQKTQPREQLRSLLEVEATNRRNELRRGATRHSRFGTTIAVKSGKHQYVLHHQKGVIADPSAILDMSKKKAKGKNQRQATSFESLSVQALSALQKTAIEFLESCFEPFFSSLLKDIKAERLKITESDNIRLLVVVRWFLEFFLSLRTKEIADDNKFASIEYADIQWKFEMVAEVVEKSWIGWVLRRMRMAMDDKPKQWTELRAGMDCLSQIVRILFAPLASITRANEPALVSRFCARASKTLQHQLYYNGEILEIALDSLKGYKQQSIAYLDSTIHLSYLLLRMLERWAKTQGEMYVRSKKKKKKITKGGGEEDGVVDEVPEEDVPGAMSQMFSEHMFTFEKFESRFAQEDVTRACLAYLARHREYDSSEKMKRVVGLMHRQAVKTKAEGLYFKVTTLDMFHSIILEQKILPRDPPYKDLIQLINYILRKFFKTVEEQPILVVEAFFPKNRGQWKQYSGYEPEIKETTKKAPKGKKPLADVEIKKGWSKEEELGIAVACLVDEGKMDLVDWVRTNLMTVIGLRLSILSEASEGDVNPGAGAPADPHGDMAEALRRFEDYSIPYVKEEYAEAATKDPHLRLVLRLVECFVKDPEADELEWYVPAAITPDILQEHLDVIARYLAEPVDLDGKKPSEMLQKKRARRTRRRTRAASPSSSSDSSDDEAVPKKRKAKRRKEEVEYKSAEFIDDALLGDDEEFYRKEEEIRRRAETVAETGGKSLMKATGTKKRKRGAKEDKTITNKSIPSTSKAGSRKKRRQAHDETDSEEGASTLQPHRLQMNPQQPRRNLVRGQGHDLVIRLLAKPPPYYPHPKQMHWLPLRLLVRAVRLLTLFGPRITKSPRTASEPEGRTRTMESKCTCS